MKDMKTEILSSAGFFGGLFLAVAVAVEAYAKRIQVHMQLHALGRLS